MSVNNTYCMWPCSGCKLLNYDRNRCCQACFKKMCQKSPIGALLDEQRVLFIGYVRMQIIGESQYDYNDIPMDILNLSFAFFGIDIKLLCIEAYKKNNLPESDNDALINNRNLCSLTKTLRQSKEYFIGYQILSMLIKFNPKIPTFHNAMGLIFQFWGSPENAAKEYQTAIKIKPRSHIYKWNYGMLLQDENKWELALKQFVNAYKLDENEAEYAFECAYCYEKIKDYELAKFYYLRAILLNPSKAKYYMYFCDYLCESLHDFQASKKYFKRLIDLQPENCEHYYQYARCLRDFGDNEYEEAEKYYKKCLEIDANNQGSNGSYGYLLYLMKRYEAAEKHLKIELNNDKKNGWAYYYYGLLNNELGHEDIANESLQTAVKLCARKTHMIQHLETIKKVDPKNMEYHNRFNQLLQEKFKNDEN